MLGRELKISEYRQGVAPTAQVPGHLTVLPSRLSRPVHPGQPDTANAGYVLATLDRAVDGCSSGEFAAMVTGPVHKAIINQAGHPFTGHTEYIADRCGRAQPVMMLMNSRLKVALATTHLPLASVPAAINQDMIEKVISIVHRDLAAKFKIARPRLLVCGLNPHAGEQGHLGHEDQVHIEPAVKKLRTAGIDVRGPVPADTAFTADSLAGVDVVISMYHDQGLPVLKSQGFGETVNITLGLPIIRTSVDHGTAFDLAGSGKASPGSLLEALSCAAQLSAV